MRVAALFSAAALGLALTTACGDSEVEDLMGDRDVNQGETNEQVNEVDVGTQEWGHLQYLADDLEWVEGPGSLAEGAEMVVLEGDPGEADYFTLRLRMPDGFVIDPHFHSGQERVTVIEGTFEVGHGEEANWDEVTALPSGAYFSIPPESPHYARADGQTVVQLNSIGPWSITYVNPEDDPRNE
ncbi:cupin domain-containing protein [Hoyosella rhizosphaerae]|nr:cupin domain-containing protein [Hoyosella rhizosphaerae]